MERDRIRTDSRDRNRDENVREERREASPSNGTSTWNSAGRAAPGAP